jgi:hypothetical protein
MTDEDESTDPGIITAERAINRVSVGATVIVR